MGASIKKGFRMDIFSSNTYIIDVLKLELDEKYLCQKGISSFDIESTKT
jgi:hypothetical protein